MSILFGARPAWGAPSAADISFQQYLQQFHYEQLPLVDVGTNAQAIDARINGKKVRLVIDTGCNVTCLNFGTARDLDLKIIDSGHKNWGVGGQMDDDTGIAPVQSFTLGGYEINRTNVIQVLPGSANKIAMCDGLFGLDFLRLNSAIILVGSRGIILKPGTTPSASIGSYMRGLGFSGVPLVIKMGALNLMGHLNGKAFDAMIDTGESFSTFDADFVRSALGHNPDFMRMEERGVDGRRIHTSRFTPNSIDFGGFSFPPETIAAATSTGIKRHGVDALLGYDLLAEHLAVIDLGSNTLWMK